MIIARISHKCVHTFSSCFSYLLCPPSQAVVNLCQQSLSPCYVMIAYRRRVMAQRPIYLAQDQMGQIDAQRLHGATDKGLFPEQVAYFSIIVAVKQKRRQIEGAVSSTNALPIDNAADGILMN